MKEQFVRTEFEIEIKQEDVFHMMDCYKDSPVYDIVQEEWDTRWQELAALAEPKAIAVLDGIDENYGRKDLRECGQVFYVIQSVGDGLGQYSTQMFEQGNALAGMLADAVADVALNSLEKQVCEWLREICTSRKLGILRRLEAPEQIPMEAQQYILEKTGAAELFGMKVSAGYMFYPVKSMGYLLITTKDTTLFRVQHNCRACSKTDCRVRAVQPVRIQLMDEAGQMKEELISEQEESVLESLAHSRTAYSFPCGGRGSCGKCRIQVLDGEIGISAEDETFFTKEELAAGYRLACRAYPTEDIRIRFCGEQDESFEALGESCLNAAATADRDDTEHGYRIAIDIGTTTLAVSLIECGSQRTVQVYTAMNRQRRYGADVIARIQASCDGKGEQLQQLVREDLLSGIREVLERAAVTGGQVDRVVIAGNTTMGHLLMGLSCESLGVAPFTPVDISMRTCSFQEVFGTDGFQIPVLLLPGISTYVGADVTAGMLVCGFAEKDETIVLIDLGTNGEMAVGNRDRILVTSTAAGPAFEGGNISCGVGSVAGAISDVSIDGTNVNVVTIADNSPTGICGTGAIAIVAELLKNEWVDETGLLDEEYFEDGFPIAQTDGQQAIVFTQKDVREMQLAIAAVRAGLETLLLRYGVDYDGVDQVYLAGGFGYKMDLQKAADVGLIPRELIPKVQAAGNSSLGGAKEMAVSKDAVRKMEQICAVSEEVSLSSDKDFNEFYMEYMMFE